MGALVVIGLFALFFWLAVAIYKSGVKDSETKHKRETIEANTPDWSTYVGEITGISEGDPMPGAYSLHVNGRSVAYCSAALKQALTEVFGDSGGRGRTVVYTIGSGGELDGFTPVEEWTGPAVPPEGIHEKSSTVLQPKHRNQFLPKFLRDQVEGSPAYTGVRFW